MDKTQDWGVSSAALLWCKKSLTFSIELRGLMCVCSKIKSHFSCNVCGGRCMQGVDHSVNEQISKNVL